ncbi:phosphatase domain-containing putative toxin [Gymnodinialimonas ulvae]|uniref:phosphatase domain-containing putative toxin n=1 Tax=Gymnodinialimonas ulvae TaxID=3126504 RepID=UPI0030961107
MTVEDGLNAEHAPPFPGSIRAAIPHPAGGRVVMSGFPGLETTVDGMAVFDPVACRETLLGLRELGAATLCVLIESDELDAEFLPSLEALAGEVGLDVAHFPIVDYAAPTQTRAQQWATTAQARAQSFAAGATLAFACQYGAGRSGTMAARCLIEGGMTPEAAIARVREHFSEAIESKAQEDWLMSGK